MMRLRINHHILLSVLAFSFMACSASNNKSRDHESILSASTVTAITKSNESCNKNEVITSYLDKSRMTDSSVSIKTKKCEFKQLTKQLAESNSEHLERFFQKFIHPCFSHKCSFIPVVRDNPFYTKLASGLIF